MPKQHNIAFLPRHATSWRKFSEIIRYLSRREDVKVHVYLSSVEMERLVTVGDFPAVSFVPIHRERAPGILAKMCRALEALRSDRLANSLFPALIRLIGMRAALRQERAVFETSFAERGIGVLVLPGDRELSPVPSAIGAARRLGIPTVIGASCSPYTSGLEHCRFPYPRFSLRWRDFPPLLNMVVGQLFPQQRRQADGRSILFSPGWIVLALKSLDMLPPNPWVQGGGHADYILQHSKERSDVFLDMGVPPQKLIFVGDGELDNLYAEKANSQNRLLSLKDKYAVTKKLIVFSVPNDAEHGITTWEEHYARLRDYFHVLSQVKGADVLLSLHPKSDRKDYADLAHEYGLTIADERLVELMPSARLFICESSSTVHWAELCAVPVINIDHFHCADGDFLGKPGIVNVHTPDEFQAALARWLDGAAPWGDLSGRAAALAEDCLFDGRAGERICDVLCGLATAARQ